MDWASTGYDRQSCLWSAELGEWLLPVTVRASERFLSRELGSAAVARSPSARVFSTLKLNLPLKYYSSTSSTRLFIILS